MYFLSLGVEGLNFFRIVLKESKTWTNLRPLVNWHSHERVKAGYHDSRSKVCGGGSEQKSFRTRQQHAKLVHDLSLTRNQAISYIAEIYYHPGFSIRISVHRWQMWWIMSSIIHQIFSLARDWWNRDPITSAHERTISADNADISR